MSVQLEIPYGHSCQTAGVPAANYLGMYSVYLAPPCPDPEKRLAERLAGPTGTPSLQKMVQGAKKVLLVCDDNTRRTPARQILPQVLDILNRAGISDRSINILFATGSHRPMTEAEMIEKVGERVFRRVKTHNHDYKRNLVYQGITSLGTPIYLNSLVAEADFVIGIGSIIPHRYCGWAGGGKIIQPGVCGEKTIAATHLLITRDNSIQLGSQENSARREIAEVARAAGLRFIINTILNSSGEIVDIVAGEPEAAHNEGIAVAKKLFGVPVPSADVVVISAYPEDLNLWQALKALYAADLVVRNGGTIILVSPLYEGIGEHREFIRLLRFAGREITQKLANGGVEDLLSAAAAYAGSQVIDRTRVLMVSDGITDSIAKQMRMRRFDRLQEAVDYALAANRDARLVCLREGTEILPVKGE